LQRASPFARGPGDSVPGGSEGGALALRRSKRWPPERGEPAVCRHGTAWHGRRMASAHPSKPHPAPLRPVPDAASLHEAALNYLARYATTEAGLRQILHRRIDAWARQAAEQDDVRERASAAKEAVAGVIARLVELGLLNDAAFAESRARGLALSGRSHRAIAARLMAKGIAPDRARAVLPEGELVAALILARKRRIGPFRTSAPDHHRELGVLARAGFPRDVAVHALAKAAEEAEAAIREARA
jgi:regulatory protein